MRALLLAGLAVLTATACRGREPDAYGNFEATEVIVAAQASGQLVAFTPEEGMNLAQGVVVAEVDPTQLMLERQQLLAQREAVAARTAEAGEQIGVLVAQRDIAQRTLARTRRLFDADAATAQQLDQAERDYRTLVAQIEAARAQQVSARREVTAAEARVAQIRDQLAKSRVTNPTAGTVLATYARAGEVVTVGTPLYKIADLSELTLRAYIDGTQLAQVRIGQPVQVNVDQGKELRSFPGTITWISAEAEFTPTPVQTRDERADLVYAIKIAVPNFAGVLKIGMPGDVYFEPPPAPAPR